MPRRTSIFRSLILPVLIALSPLPHAAAAPDPTPAAAPADPALAMLEIARTLREMEAAVLAADQERYLSFVDLSEPVFAQEHRMWAKDLTRNKPLKFALTLEEENFELGDGVAEGLLRTDWTMSKFKNEAHTAHTPEQLATPGEDRTVAFRVRFIRRETEGGAPLWLFAGEVWNRKEAPGALVLFEDGLDEVAQRVLEVLPEVRAHVEEGFGLADTELPKHVQQIKLYRSMTHLQFSIYPSYDDGIGGWNEPGEAIKILVSRDRQKGPLRTLLAHEYGHVATFFMGPKATDMPWWALEGVAELAAEGFGKSRSRVNAIVRQWAQSNNLRRWEQLADFRGEAQDHQGHVYTQGHDMIGYISERFGRDGRNAWLTRLAQGDDLDAASQAALATPWAQIDADWRAELAKPLPVPAEPKDPAPAQGKD